MTRTTQPDSLVVTAELRRPAQERGARRVEAILDAAAELVVELGVEGVTVQALADRAQTSKGSLYHFFPDVPAVFRALAERHAEKLMVDVKRVMADDTIDWPALETSEVITILLGPLDYMEGHCDLLALCRAPGVLPRTSRAMQPIVAFVDYVMASRFPAMDAERRAARAATIVAVMDGVGGTASRGCEHGGKNLRRELRELLGIYLAGL